MSLFQMAISTVLGLFGVSYGATFVYQQRRIDELQEHVARLETVMRDRADASIEKIWQAIDRLREEIRDDRRLAAADRAAIAASMVTRDELERQIGRMLASPRHSG